MAHGEFLRFLIDLSKRPAMLVEYEGRGVPQLVFAAKNDGYTFDAADMVAVRGALEANVILNIHRDPYDGTARLWRSMWGKTHLRYVVEGLVALHSEDAMWALIGGKPEGAR
jgi:hypothetical protein